MNPSPCDINAEVAVLGACMLDHYIIPSLENIIAPDDMYIEKHSIILSTIYALKGEIVDLITIRDKLGVDIEKAGGEVYLGSIGDAITTSAGWRNHANIIKEKSNLRKLITLATASTDLVREKSFNEVKTYLKEEIINLEKAASTISVEENTRFYNKVYDYIFQNKRDPGMETGIDCLLDKLYFERGYIHAIAAESGVGKSAFMLQVADNMSRLYGPCLYYSLESTRERLALRLIARHSRIALTRLNRSSFTGTGQEEQIKEACDHLADSNLILIDDERLIEIERLVSHAESYALQNKVSAIFFDYLQLAQSNKHFNSDKQRIDNTIFQIKSLAKRLDIPIIYGCQLRKDVPGRPGLDHLYESNVIRQATDNILFLYAPNTEPVEYDVELYMGKGKEQQRFSIWLHFNGNFQQFTAGDQQAQYEIKKIRGVKI